jgi:signal transduction histidine kinase
MSTWPGTDSKIDVRLLDHGEEIQRFIELGRLSASLLHEISNPLTAALIQLEQVNEHEPLNTRAVKNSLVRLSLYVNAARQQLSNQTQLKRFSANHQIREVKRLVVPLARSNQVKLRVSMPLPIKLWGDHVKFQQILVNLIVNAIEAYPKNTNQKLKRRVDIRLDCYNNCALITVTDYAGIITRHNLSKIYQPFYSTKASRKQGLGLGLYIVKHYIESDFKGSIKVTSSRHSGTRFVIKLPLKVFS